MNVSQVRIGCRHGVGLFCQRHPPHRGAGFVSLGGLPESTPRDELTPNKLRTKERFNLDLEENATNKHPLHQPWRHKLPRPHGVDEWLESLFCSSQRQRVRQKTLRYSGNPVSADKTFKVFNDLLNEEANPEALWAQFEEVIRTKAWKTSLLKNTEEKDVSLKYIVFRDFLLRICKVRSQEPFRQSIPSPAEVIRIYVKHGLMDYWWEKIFWLQLAVVLKRVRDVLFKGHTGQIIAYENINRLTADMLEVWEVFMEEHGNRIDSPPSQTSGHDPPELSDFNSSMPDSMSLAHRVAIGWRGLPTSADIGFRSAEAPTEKLHRFLHYIPNHPNVRETIKVAEAAVLTRDCIRFFEKAHMITEPVIEFAQPFLQLLEHIFQGHTPDQLAYDCLAEQGVTERTAQAVLREWACISLPEPKINLEQSSSRFDYLESRWKNQRFAALSKKVGRAVEKSDSSYLIELWQGFQSMPVLNDPDELALEMMYLQILVAFFTLRRPEMATEVWNYMIKSGRQPNQKHWNAMLAGCAKSKDLISLQGVWSNMKSAGFEPDDYSWSTWIDGLIRCGEWQQGLQALDELGEVWKKPPSPDGKPGFKPPVLSIIPINAAMSACQATRKHTLVPHILKWAESQKVPLETSTFNILLGPLVRQADHTAIDDLLASMQHHGCTPNIITLTVILNGLLNSPASVFGTLSPTAQKDSILTILHNMEEQGLPATVQTYCTILNGLLQPHNPNLVAAQAVLSHMAAKDLQASSAIYTILVSHYFALSPPDLAAIAALWQRMRSEGGIRDRFFFDRMIEGYARYGEIEKMLAMLRDALIEGKSPSWMALGEMVLALKRADERDLLEDLVADILDETNGIMRHGGVGSSGKRDFWAQVNHLVAQGYIQLPERGRKTGNEGSR